MTQIEANLVIKLRKITGQGVMDCKKALQEANGVIDEAVTILRKKGLETLKKRALRTTNQGRVICKKSDDDKIAVLLSICCETDFVANSQDFVKAAGDAGRYAMACYDDEGTQKILETMLDGKKFSEILTETVSRTGEKIQLADYRRYKLEGEGLIGTYVHFNNRVGSMVEVQTSDKRVTEGLKQTATDIAMHITAIKPIAMDKGSVESEVVEQEKAIAREQVKNKPANIVEKIVEGKMRKFFAESCLMEQPFVKDDSKSVAQVLEQKAKACGGEAKLKRFVRFEIG